MRNHLKYGSRHVMLFLALFSFVLASCSTERGFVKFHSKNDTTAAKYCILWYPVTESVTVKEVYKEGKRDTVKGKDHYVYADCDSAYAVALAESERTGEKVRLKTVYVKVPGNTLISRVDTFFRDSTIKKEVTAKLVVANARIAAIQSALDKQIIATNKEEATKKNWRKSALWGWGIILALIIITVIRLYFGWKAKLVKKATQYL